MTSRNQGEFIQIKGSQLLFKELLSHSRASEEEGRGAQFAPNQGASWADQSGTAGAQKSSSPWRDLI